MITSDELEIYCVTNKRIKFLENYTYKLASVGKDNFPDQYLKCNTLDNIFYKEEFYSELTFHYWFWKNKLEISKNKWIGFCQKRRFWLNKKINNKVITSNNFNDNLLNNTKKEWNNYNSIICEPIFVNNLKKMTIIKKGFSKIIKKPSIFFDLNKQSIKLHFDLHHGDGNLEKAIEQLEDKDKNGFYDYVDTRTCYNPHIMFIAKPEIHNAWFSTLFPWLERCEKVFGFQSLEGYRTKRLYAYLAERYLSYWFKKYSNYLEWPWTFYENK